MKTKIWWVIFFVLAAGLLWKTYSQKGEGQVMETTPDFRRFESEKGGFSMVAPSNWEATESTEEAKFRYRVVFTPGQNPVKIGNIGELSVTVIASPSANQLLSSQAEFDRWLAEPIREASGGAIVKIANDNIGGMRAVRLVELEPIPDRDGLNFWSITSWFREEGVNYYINIMGNGKDIKQEISYFDWMLSKFELKTGK